VFSLDGHKLDDDQRAAIMAEGNIFLVACPGSGKTRALTYKIALELTRAAETKKFVVAITYTHRAADEIHERIERLGIDTSQLWIGTIHSFCLEWILKPYAIYHPELRSGFRVINSHVTEKILTELCLPYKRQRVSYWDCHNYHFRKDGYVAACRDANKLPFVNDILQQYFRVLSKNRQIDFELILYYAYVLIRDNPSISLILSKIFSFILIDEYQDTKEIQYSIIAAILKAGARETGFFIVGDPNQAIYGSLGGFAIKPADFGAMAGVAFKEMPLTRNYRSSARVIDYFRNYAVRPATVTSASEYKDYPSVITFDRTTAKAEIEEELARLIKFNVEVEGIPPNEVCILAPQWVHLASMTRKLMARMPEYQFDGPGMVPFSRDIDNFWYKLAKIALTEPSPALYVTRLRWASDVLGHLRDVGVSVSGLNRKEFLRECNSIELAETNGLVYLSQFFNTLFAKIGVDFTAFPTLVEHHDSFFADSQARIDRLRREGTEFIGDIATFRKVFAPRSGITVSTIHGVKGAEYDAVIGYALLDGMVPHFSDANGDESAMKLLYVICSRAKKNLHLISETARFNGIGEQYQPTPHLAGCIFDYDGLRE